VRIAVDTRELQGRRTGAGRYVAELLAAWEALPAARAHQFIRLAPAEGQGGTIWEQLTLPGLVREAGADVLFSPAYTGPVRCPVPMVLSIHDVSYAAHPEWFSWREGARRRTLSRMAASRAARVLTISQFSKREIVAHFDLPASKVQVTYLGVTPVGRTLAVRQADREGPPHTTSSPHTILYVGSLFNRRMVPELIDGFARLARVHRDVRLELVGDNRTRPRIDVTGLIAATGAADRIGLHAYVTDEELAALYATARAFVFLSSYEGFGFTPLEALAAGIPAVVLDTPVSREIYADAAIFLSRPDPALIAGALDRAVFDEAERARVLAAAAPVLARYSWRDCAERTLAAIVAAGEGTPSRA
jgi:glycosyltransferase involved in cell wall biosynthesis